MSDKNGLGVLIKNQWNDIKSFSKIYFIYVVLTTIISVVLGLFLYYAFIKVYSASSETQGIPLNSFLSNLYDQLNINFFIFYIILMASFSYISYYYLNKKPTHSDLEKKINDFREKFDISLDIPNLKIIRYKKLIEVEREFECKHIYIITNSLSDDLNKKHSFDVVIHNLKMGKNYKFIVPDINQNKVEGYELLGILMTKLSDVKSKQYISEHCEVYLVPDELFRMCAFRDIAIYGARMKDVDRCGYVEIPYKKKTDDPTERFFIQIDNSVCRQMILDIDSIIKNSKYVEPLSCKINE